MFTLWSLVSPLEYCCQLWNPWKAKDIQAIESIQRSFTYKITEVQHLSYRERLHILKLYSLQRIREHCIIIYILKTTQHIVPNIDGTIEHTIKTRNHPRHGRPISRMGGVYPCIPCLLGPVGNDTGSNNSACWILWMK